MNEIGATTVKNEKNDFWNNLLSKGSTMKILLLYCITNTGKGIK